MKNLDNSITTVEEVTETHDGTTSDVNGNKLFVDGRYNIWYHRHLRSTGDWEKYDETRYGWHEYHCNRVAAPTGGYPGITENFDPNVYDAVEFVLCTEVGNYRAKNDLDGVIDRETVYVVADGQNGEPGDNGDTPIAAYRWYKDGLVPVKPTAVTSDEPAPGSGDHSGSDKVYPTGKWSKFAPNRNADGWNLWMVTSVRLSQL